MPEDNFQEGGENKHVEKDLESRLYESDIGGIENPYENRKDKISTGLGKIGKYFTYPYYAINKALEYGKRVAKKVILSCLVAGMCYGNSWAHYPPGETFSAFQWPEGAEPVMDGDLSEWKIVPDRYTLNTAGWSEEMSPYILPLRDGWGAVWTSWSESENTLYLAARILDNDHITWYPKVPLKPIDISWYDHLDIMIDADHSGGVYAVQGAWDENGDLKRELWDSYGSQATWYATAWPVLDNLPSFVAYTAATWVQRSPWFEGGWDYKHQVLPEELTDYELRKIEDFKLTEWLPKLTVTTYELKIVPFDKINWRGLEQSIIHNLKEGEIIGLHYGVGDQDSPVRKQEYKSWKLMTGAIAFWDASYFADFLLAPVEERVFKETLIKDTTWGRIKSTFVR